MSTEKALGCGKGNETEQPEIVPPQLRIVLLKPKYPGNVGSTARAMKNFGFRNLVLVSPTDPRLAPESFWFSHGAHDVLRGASLCTDLPQALEPVELAIGTTSRQGCRWREAMEPQEMARMLAAGWNSRPVALLFGPEDRGLAVEELARCQWVVRLPTYADCPSMNLSHAVAVLCYVLARTFATHAAQPGRAREGDGPGELHHFLHACTNILAETGFLGRGGLQDHRTMARLSRFLVRANPDVAEMRLLWALLRHLERSARRPEGRFPRESPG